MGRVFCEEPSGEWADPAGLRVTEWELYVAELVAKDVKERQVARWHDAEDGDVNLNSSQIVPYAPFSIWQMIYDWKRLRAALPVDGPIEIPDENVRVSLSLSLSLRPARNRCLHPRSALRPRRFASSSDTWTP